MEEGATESHVRIVEQQLKAFHMFADDIKWLAKQDTLRMPQDLSKKKRSKKRKGADNHRICWGIWRSRHRCLFENKKEDPKIIVAKRRL